MHRPESRQFSGRKSMWVHGNIATGLVTFVLTLGVMHRCAAAAEEGDVVNVVAGTSIVSDANVFRLPRSFGPPPGYSGKGDRINVTYVGITVDQPYAQQRFQLNVMDTATRYSTFSFLNFDALDYRAAWLWHLTPRLRGTLSDERKQALVPFADFRGFEKNLRTTTSKVFNVDAWIVENWHLLGGVSKYEMKNGQPFLAESDYRSDTGELGAQYAGSSGSSFALVQRSINGEYLNRATNPALLIDNDFRQHETEVRASWVATGLSTLNGRLTRVERHHAHFPQRDFSGTVGEVSYIWTPAGKLQIALTGRRDIGPWVDLGSTTASSSYRVMNVLTFAPTWQIDTRTSARFAFNRIFIDYLGAIVADSRPLRTDAIRSAQLSLQWSPYRFFSVAATVERDWRQSTNANFEFGDTIASFTASLKF